MQIRPAQIWKTVSEESRLRRNGTIYALFSLFFYESSAFVAYVFAITIAIVVLIVSRSLKTNTDSSEKMPKDTRDVQYFAVANFCRNIGRLLSFATLSTVKKFTLLKIALFLGFLFSMPFPAFANEEVTNQEIVLHIDQLLQSNQNVDDLSRETVRVLIRSKNIGELQKVLENSPFYAKTDRNIGCGSLFGKSCDVVALANRSEILYICINKTDNSLVEQYVTARAKITIRDFGVKGRNDHD